MFCCDLSTHLYLHLFFCWCRIKELKCPDLLVERYKPLSCSIRLWLLEHALFLVPCCVLVFNEAFLKASLLSHFQTCLNSSDISYMQLMGVILLLQRVRRTHYLSVRAEELYEQVNTTTFYFMYYCDIMIQINCMSFFLLLVSFKELIGKMTQKGTLMFMKFQNTLCLAVHFYLPW